MRTILLAILAALIATTLAASALALEPVFEQTRETYVDTLEAICKPDALATSRATEGLRADLRAERLALAARKFDRAGAIFGGTVDRIAPVRRPSADVAKLRRWFAYLGQQERYLGKIAAALHHDRPVVSQRYTALFVHNGNLANRAVISFGFDYCSFVLSRFG